MLIFFNRVLTTLAFLLLVGCIQIADYSLEAYTNATTMKARTLALVEKGTEPYSGHREDAENLLLSISEAYEFADGIENNNETSDAWALLLDEDKNFVAGFVAFWREQSPNGASRVFISEYKQNITDNFNRIICLEANKREATACPAPVEN